MVDIKLNTEKLLSFVSKKYRNGEINDDSLVQLIELSSAYLNLQTRSAAAKSLGKSYNGVKKCRKNIKLFGKNFVIDNE